MKNITPAKCRRMIRSMPIASSLQNGFRQNGWEAHLPQVYERACALYAENADASRALKTHLHQLLPMIAFYEAAVHLTGSRQSAMAFMDKWAFINVEKMAGYARLLMKLGLYRLMPAMCNMMLDRMFGHSAGFDYRPVPDAPKFSVDMTRCPYVDTCVRYGCPELARISCKTDDVTYGNLHPRLIWARTQTLGTGGSCCDFRLHLRK